MSADLLPCPFCGGTAIVEHSNALNEGAFVWHACGDCGVETEGLNGTEAARKLWNTRASTPVTPGPDAEEVAPKVEREGSREAISPIPHAMGEGAVAWAVETKSPYSMFFAGPDTYGMRQEDWRALGWTMTPLYATQPKAVTITDDTLTDMALDYLDARRLQGLDKGSRTDGFRAGFRAALTLSADEGGR